MERPKVIPLEVHLDVVLQDIIMEGKQRRAGEVNIRAGEQGTLPEWLVSAASLFASGANYVEYSDIIWNKTTDTAHYNAGVPVRHMIYKRQEG